MTTAIIEIGDVNHHGRGIGVTIIAQVDTERRIRIVACTASAEGASAETVMMTESVDIDLVGVEAGARGASEAAHLMETGGRKSRSKYRYGDILQPYS
jgi:UDP-N-acetylmuramyl tripeptide synthase